MDCSKRAAKLIHSPTEIQKYLQQAGTSVGKDTISISRNIHLKDLHSYDNQNTYHLVHRQKKIVSTIIFLWIRE